MKRLNFIIFIYFIVVFISFSIEKKYYGEIGKYPIQLIIDKIDNENIEGRYFYTKYKKEIYFIGKLENNIFSLKVGEGNDREEFIGRIDIQDKIIFGYWFHKNNKLEFYLSSKQDEIENLKLNLKKDERFYIQRADILYEKQKLYYVEDIYKLLKEYKNKTKKELIEIYEYILSKYPFSIEDIIVHAINAGNLDLITHFESFYDINSDGELEKLEKTYLGTMNNIYLSIDREFQIDRSYKYIDFERFEFPNTYCLDIIPFNKVNYVLHYNKSNSTNYKLTLLDGYSKKGWFQKSSFKQKYSSELIFIIDDYRTIVKRIENGDLKKIKPISNVEIDDKLKSEIFDFLKSNRKNKSIGSLISIEEYYSFENSNIAICSSLNPSGRTWHGVFLLFLNKDFSELKYNDLNKKLVKWNINGGNINVYEVGGEIFVEKNSDYFKEKSIIKVSDGKIETIADYEVRMENIPTIINE